jgi:hypothetical protein
MIGLSSEGDIGIGEKPSSESSSMESTLAPRRAAIFKAFSNMGDSGMLLLASVDCRLGVVVLSSE